MTPEELDAPALVLDTNVFSRLSTDDPAYERFRPFTRGRFVFLSFITVGEVLRGAYYKGWGPRRITSSRRGSRPTGYSSVMRMSRAAMHGSGRT